MHQPATYIISSSNAGAAHDDLSQTFTGAEASELDAEASAARTPRLDRSVDVESRESRRDNMMVKNPFSGALSKP